MRQQREKSKLKEPFKITDAVIMQLGELLDGPKGLHIDEVYFTSKGWYFNCTDFKKEKYAYLNFEPVYSEELKAYKFTKFGVEENKVFLTLEASKIVDDYLKLKNKNS